MEILQNQKSINQCIDSQNTVTNQTRNAKSDDGYEAKTSRKPDDAIHVS